jgi:hypothetical protein
MWLFRKLFGCKANETPLETYLRQYGKWATLEDIYATMDKVERFIHLQYGRSSNLTYKEICAAIKELPATPTSWSTGQKSEVQPREFAGGRLKCTVIVKKDLVDLSSSVLVELRRRIEGVENARERSKLFDELREEIRWKYPEYDQSPPKPIKEMDSADMLSWLVPRKIKLMEDGDLQALLQYQKYVAFCTSCSRYYSGYQCVKTEWSVGRDRGVKGACPLKRHVLWKVRTTIIWHSSHIGSIPLNY